MAPESHDDAAEKYREERLKSLRDSLSEKRRDVRHLSAFLDRLEEAGEEQLRTWFGGAMTLARNKSRDVVEIRLWFDDDADDDGTVDRTKFAAMDANAYTDLQTDLTFRVECDSWLSYDDVEARALDEVRMNLGAAESQVENATERISELER